MAKNLHRRHLTISQQALIGAKAVPFFAAEAKQRQVEGAKIGANITNSALASNRCQGGIDPGFNDIDISKQGKATKQAAAATGVGASTIERVQIVQKRAPEEIPRIASGETSLNAAYDRCRKPAADKQATKPDPVAEAVKEKVWSAPRRAAMRRNIGRIVSGITGFWLARSRRGGVNALNKPGWGNKPLLSLAWAGSVTWSSRRG